jgi:hypothetical protein
MFGSVMLDWIIWYGIWLCYRTKHSDVHLLAPLTHLRGFLPIEYHSILETWPGIQLQRLTLIQLVAFYSSMTLDYLQ